MNKEVSIFDWSRYKRIILSLIIVTTVYFALYSEAVLSYLAPQVQVGLVGIIKAYMGALFGFIVALKVAPAKVNWSKPIFSIESGAFVRVILVLTFMYVSIYYA